MAGIDIADRVVADTFLQSAPVSWAPPLPSPSARRRQTVRVAKYVLPLVAVALLASIAMWPELSRNLASGRVTWRRLAVIDPDAGQMLRPRYHGMDERQRPYTVSAESAHRAGPERLNLTAPVGDLTLQNGTWLLLRAKTGVFIQHTNELDLSDAVTLYRQDGTIMRTATATMNLKLGAATSNDYTHAEGPFGTLDAEGFTLVDKGSVIQFHGPAKLVLNGAH
jgi:lipopolysaccharide export system protein LptC